MTTVYLNGELLPLERAHISVMDRGFLFGDGVYEVIPVFGGRCFRLDEHLDRLDRSLAAIHIESPHDHAQWLDICRQLIAALQRDLPGTADQSIYIQVTRGPAPVREHRIPDGGKNGVKPTVFAYSRPLAPPSTTLPAPIACITTEDIRWARADIKSISLLANVLMTQQALAAGSREAILLRDGQVLEGASSNVFVVLGGVVYTPAGDRRILTGITRDLLVELCRGHGLPLREESIAAADLARADEIWITSSTREMVPVTVVDARPVGTGEIGPIFKQLWEIYCAFRKNRKA